jgi:uncharacterized membrane protein YqjE
MRLTRLLKTDVDELVKAEARWWVGLLNKHGIAMAAVDLAVLSALIILAWILIGPTYGVVALAATLALLACGAFLAWRRRRRARR